MFEPYVRARYHAVWVISSPFTYNFPFFYVPAETVALVSPSFDILHVAKIVGSASTAKFQLII